MREENRMLVKQNQELQYRLSDTELKLETSKSAKGNMVPAEKIEELKKEIDEIIRNIDKNIG